MTYLSPKANGCTAEVGEWINDFNPHFTDYMITYQNWD